LTPLYLGYYARSVYDSLAKIRTRQCEPTMLEQSSNLRVQILGHKNQHRVRYDNPFFQLTDARFGTV
jgi:hypothetical protein